VHVLGGQAKLPGQEPQEAAIEMDSDQAEVIGIYVKISQQWVEVSAEAQWVQLYHWLAPQA
jgi:hypothetical protein